MSTINTEYLDGQYLAKNPSFHVEDSPWKAAQIMRMLAQASSNPSTVAEVGCGAGEILVQLSKYLPGVRFFGFEISPQGYELCQSRETDRITYSNHNLTSQPGQPFDLVLCMDVFEHIEDYFTFLRVIREHGRFFIFHVPLDMNVQMVARNIPSAVRGTVGHLHYFSKDTALAVLKDCGYEIRSWFYTPSGADRPTTQGRILQIPRRICFE